MLSSSALLFHEFQCKNAAGAALPAGKTRRATRAAESPHNPQFRPVRRAKISPFSGTGGFPRLNFNAPGNDTTCPASQSGCLAVGVHRAVLSRSSRRPARPHTRTTSSSSSSRRKSSLNSRDYFSTPSLHKGKRTTLSCSLEVHSTQLRHTIVAKRKKRKKEKTKTIQE